MNEQFAAELAALWTKIRVLELKARETRLSDINEEIRHSAYEIRHNADTLLTRWRRRLKKLERKS